MASNARKELLIQMLSGMGAGGLSLLATYPLLLVVTKTQVKNVKESGHQSLLKSIELIIKKEGLSGLYNGAAPASIANVYAQACYYPIFTFFRKAAFLGQDATVMKDLLAGYLAGVITSSLTTPVWITITHKQTDRETSSEGGDEKRPLVQIAKDIYRKDGIKGFWKGILVSYVLSTNPAINYAAFELLKRLHIKFSGSKHAGAFTIFLLGAIAKVIATIITYPLITIKTRLQSRGTSPKQNLSIIQFILSVVKEEGILSMYQGISSKILQSVLTAALLFMIHDRITLALTRRIIAP